MTRVGNNNTKIGDFRACPDMESDPVFWNQPRIDRLYLDTTYCQPQYDFPAQELVIQASVFEVILCFGEPDDLFGGLAVSPEAC